MMEQQCSSKPNKTLGSYLEKSFISYLNRGTVRVDWFKENVFWPLNDDSYHDISITKGTAFNVFLNVKFLEGKLPINGYMSLYRYYKSYASYNVCMAFPFGIIDNIPIKARRAEVIFHQFFMGDRKLFKYKTTKGEIYYAGNGMILNSKFEPIIIPYYNMDISGHINSIVFEVSSSVFTNHSGLVEKFIVKHLLPWIEYVKYINHQDLGIYKIPLSLEIKSDFKDYITIPKITEGNPTTDINKFLKANKNVFIKQIWKQ